MEIGRLSGLPSSSTLIGAVMQGNQGILLICLTSHSLIAFESPLLLGARPSKRKTSDGNPLKDKHRQKKAKAKSTMLPSMQVIDLDALTSPAATTTPNPLSTPTTPLASSPPPHASSTSTSTAVPGLATNIPNTAPILSPEPCPPSAPDLSMSTSMQG